MGYRARTINRLKTLPDGTVTSVPVDPDIVRRLGRKSRAAPIPDIPHEEQDIALRCHVEPPGWEAKRRRRSKAPWSEMAFLMCTIPVRAAGEALWFGFSALLPSTDPGTRPVSWVIFYREGLPASDVEALGAFAAAHGMRKPVPLREFLYRFYALAYVKHVPFVGWELAADLSRMAADWSPVTRGFYEGGFRLILWTHPPQRGRRWPGKRPILRNGEVENGDRPGIYVKAIDGRRAFIGFGKRFRPDERDLRPEGEAGKPKKGYGKPGHPVDVGTFAFGLSGTLPDTLGEACRFFEVPFSPVEFPEVDRLTDERVEAAFAETCAIGELYLAELREHRALGLPVAPDKVFSPATYAEGYFEQMGLSPVLYRQPDFPREVLGRSMGALHGGECIFGIRRVPEVPLQVRPVDFRGLFPVIAGLEGVMELLAARKIEVRDEDPAEVASFIRDLGDRLRAWIKRGEPDDEPPITADEWRRLARTFVNVAPNGDVLPHKVQAGKPWVMKVAPLTLAGLLPFNLAAALRSYLETGRVPKIERVVSLRPIGTPQLDSIVLPSGRRIYPNREDFFVELAAERIRLERRSDISDAERDRWRGFLKLVSNAACSGLLSEVISGEWSKRRKKALVWGPDGKRAEAPVHVREEPGRWYFPPVAAAVQEGARLMLAIARLAIEAKGGIVTYGDTDSLYPATTAEGELIPCPGGAERTEDGARAVRALPVREVETVRAMIDRLSPYPGDLRPYDHVWVEQETDPVRLRVPRRQRAYPVAVRAPLFLKLEEENFAGGPSWPTQAYLWPVAPKRYALCQLTRPGPSFSVRDGVMWPTEDDLRRLTKVRVVRASEHALTYMPPAGAGPNYVEEGFEYLIRRDLGLPLKEPGWFAEPALFRISIAHPEQLAAFEVGKRRTRRSVLRPFSRMAVGVPLSGPSHGEGRITPVAPWHQGFGVPTGRWHDLRTGDPVEVRVPRAALTERDLMGERVLIRSMWDVFLRHARRADPTKTGPDGATCGPDTAGVLTTIPTTAHGVFLVGKETRRLPLVGITQDPEYVVYAEPDIWPGARGILRDFAQRPGEKQRMAAEARVGIRTLERVIAGGRPSKTTKTALVTVAAVRARRGLREQNLWERTPEGDHAAIAAYQAQCGGLPRRCGACGAPIAGSRSRYCGPACRQHAYRTRRAQVEDTASATIPTHTPKGIAEG